MKPTLKVAYFTMEIGLESRMPTYAGGLGMLAADLMRSCADLSVPACCVTVCWQHGYMSQHIHPDGSQDYHDVNWNPSDFMERVPQTVTVTVEGRDIHVGAWVYTLVSGSGAIPVYFLDTNLPENEPQDRDITKYLYGGDGTMRLKQEVVLGIGGVRLLRALGYQDVGTYHMNEGHAAFLTLELLREREYRDENVRPSCAFTTHTPVKAGHDVFPYDMAYSVVGDMLPWHIRKLAGEESLSMTLLAMHLSHYTCGVSRIHSQVSRSMFPGEHIDSITNGIHHITWACQEIQELLDRYADGWREDPSILERTCRDIPGE
ncbi:MAG: alpha-glucan family phosphorylase, partial [Candidatus Peribacteraceae bacterium]